MPSRLFAAFVFLVWVTTTLPSHAELVGTPPSQEASGAQSPAWVLFTSRPPSRPIPNRAVRRLEAENTRFHQHGWLDATTAVSPEGAFTFTVTGEGGSGLVRGRVLKPALEAEQASASSDPGEFGFTTANYVITDLGTTPEGLAKLGLAARRADRMLLNGFVLVNPADASLVYVEGRLAKSPSFWTTRVDVVRRYQAYHGHALLVEFESTAELRMFGSSRFRMQIRYEDVAGVPVEPSATPPGVPAEAGLPTTTARR